MVDDFDWTSNIQAPVKIPHWSGRSDGTEPGNGNKTFIYVDENGMEHSVKVGGTAYKHNTRRYDGTYFSNDGDVSFYDSSITDDDITQGNNDVDYDPFDGKYEVKMTRQQYNEYIQNGRLKYQMYDNFHPVNESEFEWADNWVNDTPTIGQEYYFDYDMGSESILVRVVSINGDMVRFKVLDEDFIQHHTEMFYDEEYGWDPIDSIGIEGFMDSSKKKELNESEFDWVDEVKPFNLSSCNWIIETTNGDEWAEVEQFLFDNGWKWGDAEEGEQIHSDYEENFHFFYPDNYTECENEMFDAANLGTFYNRRNELLEEFQDSTFYKWSDIRSFHINESNDFDWAEETPIPPIHVGGKLQTPNGNILTITKIDYKRKLTGVIQMVHWRVFHDGQWGDASDRYWDVEKRIEDGIWIPVT